MRAGTGGRERIVFALGAPGKKEAVQLAVTSLSGPDTEVQFTG